MDTWVAVQLQVGQEVGQAVPERRPVRRRRARGLLAAHGLLVACGLLAARCRVDGTGGERGRSWSTGDARASQVLHRSAQRPRARRTSSRSRR